MCYISLFVILIILYRLYYILVIKLHFFNKKNFKKFKFLVVKLNNRIVCLASALEKFTLVYLGKCYYQTNFR